MNIESQYIVDTMKNPISVFFDVEKRNKLSEKVPFDIPQWQKELNDIRIEEYRINPDITLDWNSVVKEFEKEDEVL